VVTVAAILVSVGLTNSRGRGIPFTLNIMKKAKVLKYNTTFNQVLFIALGIWHGDMIKEVSDHIGRGLPHLMKSDSLATLSEGENYYQFLGRVPDGNGYHFIKITDDSRLVHELVHFVTMVFNDFGFNLHDNTGEELFAIMMRETFKDVTSLIALSS